MKKIVPVARVLLGLIFLLFGLNGFIHFLPNVTPPGLAGQYFTVLFVSHYLVLVFLIQTIGAVLLLANRFVPLALTLLAPVIVNILQFHFLLAPGGLPLALVTTALWGIVFWSVRRNFAGLFAARA